MSLAYYNEIDPFAAQWLRNLSDRGLISRGSVDGRSITDVRPDDVAGYRQCHFFAGIGGWAYALKLAGWPDEWPVWTGSPPCQPFSAAGKGRGFDDERHLWPAWFELIEQCRPPVIFGEQVEAAIRHGWLDLVQDGLESLGYTCWAVCLPAACVGAPHIRHRIWFVGHSCEQRRDREHALLPQEVEWHAGNVPETARDGVVGWLDDTSSEGLERFGSRHQPKGGRFDEIGPVAEAGESCGAEHPSPVDGFWRDADWIFCRDGKWRSVEPGAFPLAHGIPARVGRLRAYGNAIVPQVAAEVIKAMIDWIRRRERPG